MVAAKLGTVTPPARGGTSPRMQALPPVLIALVLTGCTSPSGSPPGDLRLGAASFLQGLWGRTSKDIMAEERWSPPCAGTMFGYGRTMKGDATVSWEHLRIELQGDTLAYVASPKGQNTTRFVLADHGEGFVAFHNPAHDFPQRIEYRRSGELLHARVTGDGADALEWTFERQE